jgi:hypothetical protein
MPKTPISAAGEAMPAVKLNPFHNMSIAAIADLIGDLDAEAKALEARIKAAKAELSARSVDRAEGERFTVTKSETCRWTLSVDAVRAAMGEAWATAHSKVAAVVSFRITVNRAALAAAA